MTDYISARLRAFSSAVRAGETRTVRAGNLYHLQTELRASIPEQKLEAITQILYPTPAVCGLLQPQARAFLLEHENYTHAFYTGFLGFKHPDNTRFYVNLRCAQLYANGVRYFAGRPVEELLQIRVWFPFFSSCFHRRLLLGSLFGLVKNAFQLVFDPVVEHFVVYLCPFR